MMMMSLGFIFKSADLFLGEKAYKMRGYERKVMNNDCNGHVTHPHEGL